MQVVKNDFLAGLERDGRYKLLQIQYARMLEKEMSKEDILERYLNTVFFGNNAYGIQAAAETYFGKTAAELDVHRSRRSSPVWCGRRRASTRSTSPSAAVPAGSRSSTVSSTEEVLTEDEADFLEEDFVLPRAGEGDPGS